MKQAPTGRAVGNDHLPADVLHCFTGSLSLPLFQIILKFSCRLQEPVQWKGGPSRPFGSKKACKMYVIPFVEY